MIAKSNLNYFRSGPAAIPEQLEKLHRNALVFAKNPQKIKIKWFQMTLVCTNDLCFARRNGNFGRI